MVERDADRDYILLPCSGEGRERLLVIDVERCSSRAVHPTTPRSTTRTATGTTLATTVTAAATATTGGTLKAGIDLDEDFFLLLSFGLWGGSLGLKTN